MRGRSLIPDCMKFLVSQMARLTLRLLETNVQASNHSSAADSPSNERSDSHKMDVCQAVEDRICKRIDLAFRTDLTDRQAMAALHLLLKIVLRNDLPVEFSAGEIFMLLHGVPDQSRHGTAGVGKSSLESVPRQAAS